MKTSNGMQNDIFDHRVKDMVDQGVKDMLDQGVNTSQKISSFL